MGLFSETPKTNPKVIVEGVEIIFQLEHEWWEFTHRGSEFCSFGSALTLPSKAQLDGILNTLESLKPEMRSRLKKGLIEWGDDSKPDDGELYSVNVQDFIVKGTFEVSWSGGKSWGDLGLEFTIKGDAIIDEAWGD